MPITTPLALIPTKLAKLTRPLVSTKFFPHELGFSATFRQHKAESHCRFLHGYALSIKLWFTTDEPDVRGWVVDFGSLKSLKQQLEAVFDHKTLVASDDPLMNAFLDMAHADMIDMVVVPATGCEAFAQIIYAMTLQWLVDNDYAPRVSLTAVEVAEHGANSAVCCG